MRMGGAARIALLATLASMLCAPAGADAASTFNVTRLDDPDPTTTPCVPGDCSLRAAVIAANADPGSTINVPAGRVVLTRTGTDSTGINGDLDIDADMTIRGAGSGATTVDASAIDDRAFEMEFEDLSVGLACDSDRTVNISGLTITGGNGHLALGGGKPLGGGAIAVCGTLNLSDSVLTGNQAIGGGAVIIGADATANIDRTTISGNDEGGSADNGGGGGILVQPTSTLNLTNSTLTGNSAGGDSTTGYGGGGAIMNLGEASLTNTTVTGNSAGSAGAPGIGGGILTVATVTTTLVNSTIASNTAGSGGDGLPGCGGNLSDTLDPIACTPGPGSTTLKNTIVAYGNASGAANCAGGGFTSQGNNLDSLDQCNLVAGADQRNTDPQLGPLSDNGGPTQTRALLAGSPAINGGANTGCPTADQRGITRPQALICDIGAYELVFAADLGVTKSAPASVTLGNHLTYTVTVTNHGPQPAAGVRLVDTIPGATPLVSATPLGICGGSPFGCTLPDLAPGASATVTIVTRPRATGSVTNTATVSGTYADPNPANNTAAPTTTVTAAGGRPALRARISGVPASCRRANFSIRVRSTTTGALRDVRVFLDRRLFATHRSKSFRVTIPARRLRPGRHSIIVYSRGTRGQFSRAASGFVRCPNPSPRFTG